jgi:DNA-binding beta-propeller fold protein YncE
MTRSAVFLPLLATLAALGAGCAKDLVCAQGELDCNGRCTSVQIDSSHCGTCGNSCGAYQECNAGACECGPGTTQLQDGCFDLHTSALHCGASDVSCGVAEVCATSGETTACASACPGSLAACDGGCVDLQADRWNCGGCGTRCDRGESCRAGTCAPDLYVACFATDDVRPLNAALRTGLPRPAGDGPIALTVAGSRLWVAGSISHSLVSFPLDLGGAGKESLLGGSDLEAIASRDGLVYTANVGSGSLVVFDAATGRVVDEVNLEAVPGTATGINPRGIAFAGGHVYVALYGLNAQSGGQEVVRIDGIGTEASGAVVKRVSVADLADAPGLAFPSHLAVVGTKVYATLANLKLDGQFYTAPAGHSKLAVLDTASDDALTSVDLGEACTNAGGMTVSGATLWVACGGSGKLLPVDVSGVAPAVGLPIPSQLIGPGNIAFCAGMGYVTDQWSGTVERFDPQGGGESVTAELCPTSSAGWSWAADLACAP